MNEYVNCMLYDMMKRMQPASAETFIQLSKLLERRIGNQTFREASNYCIEHFGTPMKNVLQENGTNALILKMRFSCEND